MRRRLHEVATSQLVMQWWRIIIAKSERCTSMQVTKIMWVQNESCTR